VQGFGAGHGTPRIRIKTDHLTVQLLDRATTDLWAASWTEVENTANSAAVLS